jgi:hypothetical protein
MMKADLTYLRLEWGPDFQQHETGLIAPDDVPQLTTSSAEIACQQLPLLKVVPGYLFAGQTLKLGCIP